MTVNQILVFCLIAVLVAFLVILGRMAATAIGLLKNAKVLVGDAQGMVADGKVAVENCKTSVVKAANSVVDNATTVDKAVCGAAAFTVLLNLKNIIRRRTFLGKGLIGAFLTRRDRKKAEKELRKTKKEVSRLRKATRREAKASKKATKMARKLRNKK